MLVKAEAVFGFKDGPPKSATHRSRVRLSTNIRFGITGSPLLKKKREA
jgi:hypothetical protein